MAQKKKKFKGRKKHQAQKPVTKQTERKESQSQPEPQTKKEKIHAVLNKLLGTIIVCLSFVLLSFAGIFIYLKIFAPQSLSSFLPAAKTIAFFETDLKSANGLRFFNLFQDKPYFSRENMIAKVENYLNADFKQDINPWLGGKIGLSLLKTEKDTAAVLFVETKNPDQTLAFLKKLATGDADEQMQTEKYGKNLIYSFSLSQNFYFGFLNKYLILSSDNGTLKTIIDTYRSKNDVLRKNQKYLKIANNLSLRQLAFGYLDTENSTGAVENSKWVESLGFNLALLKPVLAIFPAGGFSLSAQKNGLFLQTYLSVDKKELKDEGFFHYEQKYKPHLTSFVEKDIMIFTGGRDFVAKLKRLLEIFNEVHPGAAILAEAALRAQKTTYFGEEISLENDIYPLFSGEHALIITLDEEKKPVLKLVLELQNPQEDRRTIEKIKDEFLHVSAFLKPSLAEVTLEDGTVEQQITGLPGNMNEEKTTYRDIEITVLTVSDRDSGIFYAISDNVAVFSNNLKSLKTSLDIKKGKKESLEKSELYQSLSLVNRSADEVSIINLTEIENLPEFLTPFKTITSGKNIFDDGISTINYLEVK